MKIGNRELHPISNNSGSFPISASSSQWSRSFIQQLPDRMTPHHTLRFIRMGEEKTSSFRASATATYSQFQVVLHRLFACIVFFIQIGFLGGSYKEHSVSKRLWDWCGIYLLVCFGSCHDNLDFNKSLGVQDNSLYKGMARFKAKMKTLWVYGSGTMSAMFLMNTTQLARSGKFCFCCLHQTSISSNLQFGQPMWKRSQSFIHHHFGLRFRGSSLIFFTSVGTTPAKTWRRGTKPWLLNLWPWLWPKLETQKERKQLCPSNSVSVRESSILVDDHPGVFHFSSHKQFGNPGILSSKRNSELVWERDLQFQLYLPFWEVEVFKTRPKCLRIRVDGEFPTGLWIKKPI